MCSMPRRNRLAGGAQLLQREAGEQRDQQGLQHRVRRERGDQRLGDDAEQEVGGAFATHRLLVRLRRRGGIQVQPRARVQQIAHHQADHQRERGHHQEVTECEQAYLAHLRGLGDRADPEHDGAEDDGRDHHFDQGDESGAQWRELLCHTRRGESDDHAEHHGDHNRDIEAMGRIAVGRLRRVGTVS